MISKRYIAYHVDLSGNALASYELAASEDEAAKIEARKLLKFHPSIEVWLGARHIARLSRQ
jgi:hypothetical protein